MVIVHRGAPRKADSDLELLVFLASRGRDVAHPAGQLMREWKIQENEALADYNSSSSLKVQFPWPEVITALPLSGRRRRWRATLQASEACCSKAQRRNWCTTGPRGRSLHR